MLNMLNMLLVPLIKGVRVGACNLGFGRVSVVETVALCAVRCSAAVSFQLLVCMHPRLNTRLSLCMLFGGPASRR